MTVTIDEHGHLAEIDLLRWRDSTKPARHEPFGATITSTRTVDRVRIADAGDVGWERHTPARPGAVFFHYRLTAARFLGPTSGSDP